MSTTDKTPAAIRASARMLESNPTVEAYVVVVTGHLLEFLQFLKFFAEQLYGYFS
jgi:hypothetical protein